MRKKNLSTTDSKVEETFSKMNESVDNTLSNNSEQAQLLSEEKPGAPDPGKPGATDPGKPGAPDPGKPGAEPASVAASTETETIISETNEVKSEAINSEKTSAESTNVSTSINAENNSTDDEEDKTDIKEDKTDIKETIKISNTIEPSSKEDIIEIIKEKLLKVNNYSYLSCGRHIKDEITYESLKLFYAEFVSYGISSKFDAEISEILSELFAE